MRQASALVVSAALALTATHSAALSCMQPDPMMTLQQAMADTGVWVVLAGVLDYPDDAALPTYDMTAPPPRFDPVIGWFSGAGLSPGGFDQPWQGSIVLQPECAGPWCGGLPGQGDVLMFARVLDDGSYQVPLSPCAQHVFAAPAPALAAQMARCLDGGDCADGGF